MACSFLFLSGCVTGGVTLKDTPLGLSETRRSIVSVIGEPRIISQNGREMQSQYYAKDNKPIAKMDMARSRYYTHVIILGDRRPYDIQVIVKVEVRTEDGQFEYAENDDDKSEFVAGRIQEALNQSRDGRNIIDDFRSF